MKRELESSIYLWWIIYRPESSKGVRFVPLHQKQTLLGLKFDTLVGCGSPRAGASPRSEVISMTSAVTATGDSSQWQHSTGVMVPGWVLGYVSKWVLKQK